MSEETSEEKYLGDGLYLSFDGYQLKLRAPREYEDHEVYMDPTVLDSFLTRVARLGVGAREMMRSAIDAAEQAE